MISPTWNPYAGQTFAPGVSYQVNPWQASAPYQVPISVGAPYAGGTAAGPFASQAFAGPYAGQFLLPSYLAGGTGIVQPRVDLFETNSDVVVACELPNVNPNDLNLTVTDDSVTISANAFWATGTPSAFYRAVTLPTTVRPEHATAIYTNGVLEVRMPKSDLAGRRRLKVNITR
ncbi:MAG: Hsp20/alpha crystallin family protein [Acetobacteraceae bacterium]|nr:Hsp20/alpha crystallin family protein [Acetobacteraceae bacterium]